MPTYLVIGPSGVGKSSLINLLLGDRVCATSEYEDCTTEVSKYSRLTIAGSLHLIDTPGFGGGSSVADQQRLKMARDFTQVDGFDVALLVFRGDERRLRPYEVEGLKMIWDVFGPQVFDRSWLALTFCASIPRQTFSNFVASRELQIGEQIRFLSSKFDQFDRTLLTDVTVRRWAQKSQHALSALFDR